MANKKSIRFWHDRQVRAVWDESLSKWWFSAVDVVAAINGEDDYVKAGNYWRWLKRKFKADGIQLVSVTHDFKYLDWFTYSDNTIDGQSKKKAYSLFESGLLETFMKGIDYSYYYEQNE